MFAASWILWWPQSAHYDAHISLMLLCALSSHSESPPDRREVTESTSISSSAEPSALPRTRRLKDQCIWRSVASNMADPKLTSPSGTPLRSPNSSLTLSFPFLREGSRVWEEGKEQPLPRDLPSPLPTKRTRTYSA